MNYYSFENLNITSSGLYNLFEKTIVNNIEIPFSTIIVNDEFKGRLDLICKYLYGNTDYIEELMVLNNIINPYSIKSGTILKYYDKTNSYRLLYGKDPEEMTKKDEILQMNKNKQSRKDSNRIGYPPTIKPDNLKQIDINYNQRKITIMNKYNA